MRNRYCDPWATSPPGEAGPRPTGAPWCQNCRTAYISGERGEGSRMSGTSWGHHLLARMSGLFDERCGPGVVAAATGHAWTQQSVALSSPTTPKLCARQP